MMRRRAAAGRRAGHRPAAAELLLPAPPRPVLLYRSTCPHCRVLSRLAVGLSLGIIQRRPLDSAEAQALYEAHPGTRGRLALVHGPSVYWGARALPGAVVAIAAALARRLWRLLARPLRRGARGAGAS